MIFTTVVTPPLAFTCVQQFYIFYNFTVYMGLKIMSLEFSTSKLYS
jgi:hypothetical protein